MASEGGARLPEVIDAPAAAEAAARGEVVLIDIRRPDEWATTGVPEGAVCATLQAPDFIDQVGAAVGGDLDRPVVLICRSGNRTLQGMALLRSVGFTQVGHVAEGMSGSGYGPGWLARGLALDARG